MTATGGAVQTSESSRTGQLMTLMLFVPPVLVYGLQRWTGTVAAMWLLFSLAMLVVLARRHHLRAALPALGNLAVVGMIAFPAAVLILLLLFGGTASRLDNPSRFLLLTPVVVVVAAWRPGPRSWFAANAIGGITGGALAINQVIIEQLPLATGWLDNPNKFAYLATLSALISLAGMRLAKADRPPVWLLGPGFALGVSALLLSSTRGAWLAFSLALGGWFVLSRAIRLRTRLAVVALVIGGALILSVSGAQVIQERWAKTGVELTQYFEGNWQNSSIGERFELWRGAAIMIGKNPLAGVGLNEYNKQLRELVAQGRLSPQISDHGHAHNELLMWWATGGLIGLFGVTAALLGPWIYFVRHAARASRRGRQSADSPALRRYQACAIAGALMASVTFFFCLFDAFFYIQFATVYYALTAYILIGFVEAYRQ